MRIVLPGLAVCWLVVAGAALHGRRVVQRQAPTRWHRAVDTLRGLADSDDVPVAVTWCTLLTRTPVLSADLPRQRTPSRPHELSATPGR